MKKHPAIHRSDTNTIVFPNTMYELDSTLYDKEKDEVTIRYRRKGDFGGQMLTDTGVYFPSRTCSMRLEDVTEE